MARTSVPLSEFSRRFMSSSKPPSELTRGSSNSAVIFLPSRGANSSWFTDPQLTFIAGVYGMNFEYMPELEQPWAYPAVWLVMLLVSLGMLLFFKRKRWI